MTRRNASPPHYEDRQIEAGPGARLSYRIYGAKGTGARPPIVFVHGLASSGLQFRRDAEHFAAKGYDVIVPNLRGHGSSDSPSTDKSAFSIENLAADLLAVIDDARAERIFWVGNSLGGMLALHLVGTQHASRFASLSIFGTCFSLDLPAITPALFGLPFRFPGKAMTARLTARLTTRSPEGRHLVRKAIDEHDPVAGAAIVDHLRKFDAIANARNFQKPFLLIRGSRDLAVNRRLERDLPQLARLNNLRIVDIPHAGHCANLDAPAAFRSAIEENLLVS